MIDIIRDAERRSLNVVPLHDLLKEADARFRQAVVAALREEGFELDEPLPCLQHPLEIAEAIRWMETLDFGSAWKRFDQALLAASRTGILVDLSRNAVRSATLSRKPPGRRRRRRPDEPSQAFLIRIEYRSPGLHHRWNWFGTTTRPGWAAELLEVCRQQHPDCECRLQREEGVPEGSPAAASIPFSAR
jgi:hypothetical protein